MAAYILCDESTRESLFPFTGIRPVADCRIGIMTIREKWEYSLQQSTSTLTVAYLAEKYPARPDSDNYWINGGLLPDVSLLEAMEQLKSGERLVSGSTWLMSRCQDLSSFENIDIQQIKQYNREFSIIHYPWDIARLNGVALRADFQRLTNNRPAMAIPSGTKAVGLENIFIEEGGSVLSSILNATEGPIYIGKDALVMEGSLIRGPFAMGEKAVVKMGAKIYGATTLGPGCTVGGEIKNSVLFGFSNKAHDGYLGDSVIGEWCNLGAGSSCSNLKNNAGQVKIWNEQEKFFVEVGNKCGLLMGDYSRSAINSSFNTGSLVGVSCNIFARGFPEKYIASFSWGGDGGVEKYEVDRAIRDASGWMKLKGKTMDSETEDILRILFEQP